MTKSFPILAIESALGPCAVALWDKETGASFSKIVASEREQAKILVPMIKDLLREASTTFEDLRAIVTTIGPGSFTGLRISLSTARTLGLALNIPVIGVTTTSAAAHQLRESGAKINGTLCIVLETKRPDFYAQVFESPEKAVSEPFSDSALNIIRQYPDKPITLAGNATQRFYDELKEGGGAPEVSILAWAGLDPVRLAKLYDIKAVHCAPVPLYLRGADVSQSKQKARVLAS